MEKNSEKELLAALSQYGYPLFEPEGKADPNELLAQLVRSGDPRLTEGFPVVLAECLKRDDSGLDLHKVEKLVGKEKRPLLNKLLGLSSYLFELYRLSVPKDKVLLKLADNESGNEFAHNQPLKLDDKELDAERLQKTFFEYSVRSRMGLERSLEAKTKMQVEFKKEYNLSLLLTPRQKELVYKRLRGEKMTKTETEYFSRVVKKKLLALADTGLQRLAQRVLGLPGD